MPAQVGIRTFKREQFLSLKRNRDSFWQAGSTREVHQKERGKNPHLLVLSLINVKHSSQLVGSHCAATILDTVSP